MTTTSLRNTSTLIPLLLLSLGACSGADGEDSGAPDAGGSEFDAAPAHSDCSGDTPVLELSGAFERSIGSLVYVSVGGEIKGFGSPAESLVFKTASSALSGHVHELGTYDVSEADYHWLFSDYQPGDPLCESSPCEGFYAMAGSFEVTEHQAIYRAEFALEALHEITAEGPGAPIAGSVSGCLVIDAP